MTLTTENIILTVVIIATATYSLLSYKENKKRCAVLAAISIGFSLWLGLNVFSLYHSPLKENNSGSIYKDIK